MQSGSLSVRDFLSVIFRRLYILVTLAICIPLATWAFCRWVPPVFETGAKVIVTAKKENTRLLVAPKDATGSSAFVNLNVDESDLNSEMEIILSMDLWVKTVKKLGLDYFGRDDDAEQPDGIKAWLRHIKSKAKFADDGSGDQPEHSADALLIRAKAEELRANCTVETIPKSKVIDITFRYGDPEKAQHILATHLDMYIPYHLEVYALPGAQVFFSGQGNEYQKKFEKANQRLIDFKTKWGISSPEKQKDELIVLISQVEDSLIAVTSDLTQYRNMLQSLKQNVIPTGQLAVSIKRGNENSVITAIATQLLDAERNRSRALQRYSSKSRDYKAAEAAVTELIARFRDTLGTEIAVLKAKKASLEKSVKDSRNQLAQLEEKAEEAQRLELAAGIAKERYLKYISKEEEARLENMMKGNKLVNVSVLSRPFLAISPIFPKTKLFIFGALLIAVPLGVGLILIANFLDHTFDKPEDVESATGYPCLASLGRL